MLLCTCFANTIFYSYLAYYMQIPSKPMHLSFWNVKHALNLWIEGIKINCLQFSITSST
jgi:hypothetical protein